MKFDKFTNRELMILWYWCNHSNYSDLSSDVVNWDYVPCEQEKNDSFIKAADSLDMQLQDEIINRFVPCAGNRHDWDRGLLDESCCEHCGITVYEAMERLPGEVEVETNGNH